MAIWMQKMSRPRIPLVSKPKQLELLFVHEIPDRGERGAVRIRIPQKFVAEQYLFDFEKKLTKDKLIYNKRTTW